MICFVGGLERLGLLGITTALGLICVQHMYGPLKHPDIVELWDNYHVLLMYATYLFSYVSQMTLLANAVNQDEPISSLRCVNCCCCCSFFLFPFFSFFIVFYNYFSIYFST